MKNALNPTPKLRSEVVSSEDSTQETERSSNPALLDLETLEETTSLNLRERRSEGKLGHVGVLI